MRGFHQINDELVNFHSKGFYFYDGRVKACTLYSNVDDQYFNGHFCAARDPKDRQERDKIDVIFPGFSRIGPEGIREMSVCLIRSHIINLPSSRS